MSVLRNCLLWIMSEKVNTPAKSQSKDDATKAHHRKKKGAKI